MDYAKNYLLYTLNQYNHFNESSIALAYGYVFEFKRIQNNIRFANDQETVSSYIVIVNIKDSIGSIIYSFKMDESDTMRALECIGEFLYYYTDTDSSMYIGFPMSNNSNGRFPTLYFYNTSRICDEYEEDTQNKANVYFNYPTGESRYIDLTVIDDCANGDKRQILKIPMCASEVEDMMFQICIAINVDLGDYLQDHFGDSEFIFGY